MPVQDLGISVPAGVIVIDGRVRRDMAVEAGRAHAQS